jgi:hypothetical protein
MAPSNRTRLLVLSTREFREPVGARPTTMVEMVCSDP